MSRQHLHAAFELVRSNASIVYFAGDQPADRVARAQAALGIEFPPTYKEFVTKLGCGGLGSAEFYGVSSDDFEHASVPNGIWLRLEYRKEASAPREFIIVGNTGDGGAYAIDTAHKGADGESPVVEWWPDHEPRIIASDFGAFFLDKLTQAVARAKVRTRESGSRG